MCAKFVRTTSTIYKRNERKLLRERFTLCIVDAHPCKIFRYLVTGCHKNCQLVAEVPKAHVGPTIVRTESLLSREIKKMFWRLFIGDYL